jgi:hypothetical protein
MMASSFCLSHTFLAYSLSLPLSKVVAVPHMGSILPTFYEQLLRTQIPKVQKNTVKLSVFFALLGSACVKAAHKMLVKSTPGLWLALPSA